MDGFTKITTINHEAAQKIHAMTDVDSVVIGDSRTVIFHMDARDNRVARLKVAGRGYIEGVVEWDVNYFYRNLAS